MAAAPGKAARAQLLKRQYHVTFGSSSTKATARALEAGLPSWWYGHAHGSKVHVRKCTVEAPSMDLLPEGATDFEGNLIPPNCLVEYPI